MIKSILFKKVDDNFRIFLSHGIQDSGDGPILNYSNKKDIIVTALENYFDELKRKSYEDSFKRATNDHEQMSLANEGIGEYLKLLDK